MSESQIKDGHPLYDAAVGYVVSQKTDTDSWEKIAKFVATFPSSDTTIVEATFKTVEAQMKADFGLTSLPAAWRSAKATALKAHKNGIVLVNSDSNVVGKTAVSKAYKAAVPPVVKDEWKKWEEEALEHLTEAVAVLRKYNAKRYCMTEKSKAELQGLVSLALAETGGICA
jgi:hypothetical protein